MSDILEINISKEDRLNLGPLFSELEGVESSCDNWIVLKLMSCHEDLALDLLNCLKYFNDKSVTIRAFYRKWNYTVTANATISSENSSTGNMIIDRIYLETFSYTSGENSSSYLLNCWQCIRNEFSISQSLDTLMIDGIRVVKYSNTSLISIATRNAYLNSGLLDALTRIYGSLEKRAIFPIVLAKKLNSDLSCIYKGNLYPYTEEIAKNNLLQQAQKEILLVKPFPETVHKSNANIFNIGTLIINQNPANNNVTSHETATSSQRNIFDRLCPTISQHDEKVCNNVVKQRSKLKLNLKLQKRQISIKKPLLKSVIVVPNKEK
ncbi:hypothetical protein PVAND_015680 [Polypedilum vanderplanki]|uniref:Uncharacterized protein n=1 Tax=Polypedilum vanderplanki TaxID=319348 RepID=A0A9J6BD92_POLVA|nr:hypothetical protein PVAND_015680 [Polypedilum vanderplanki]